MTAAWCPAGAVFDLDGTLLDSMGVWEQIDRRFLTGRGLPVPPDYVRAVTPMGFRQAAVYTVRRFGLSETADAVLREWEDMARDAYACEVRLKPGAEALLRRMKERGVRLGVATALAPALYLPALDHNGVRRLFSAFADLSEVSCGKGFPDIYRLAARRLGVDPADCVVFEDIAAGIRGARAGGFRTCGVFDPASAEDWAQICALADRAVTGFGQLLDKTAGF